LLQVNVGATQVWERRRGKSIHEGVVQQTRGQKPKKGGVGRNYVKRSTKKANRPMAEVRNRRKADGTWTNWGGGLESSNGRWGYGKIGDNNQFPKMGEKHCKLKVGRVWSSNHWKSKVVDILKRSRESQVIV